MKTTRKTRKTTCPATAQIEREIAANDLGRAHGALAARASVLGGAAAPDVRDTLFGSERDAYTWGRSLGYNDEFRALCAAR